VQNGQRFRSNSQSGKSARKSAHLRTLIWMLLLRPTAKVLLILKPIPNGL
jgi:hypothetical protein